MGEEEKEIEKPREIIDVLGNYCILCTAQKNLQNNSLKVQLTLFNNGNNRYDY